MILRSAAIAAALSLPATTRAEIAACRTAGEGPAGIYCREIRDLLAEISKDPDNASLYTAAINRALAELEEYQAQMKALNQRE